MAEEALLRRARGSRALNHGLVTALTHAMPSTVIRDFDYDPEHLELTITFVTGRIYCYGEVSRSLFDEFATAPSKGAFFNRHIRPLHPYRELVSARLGSRPAPE